MKNFSSLPSAIFHTYTHHLWWSRGRRSSAFSQLGVSHVHRVSLEDLGSYAQSAAFVSLKTDVKNLFRGDDPPSSKPHTFVFAYVVGLTPGQRVRARCLPQVPWSGGEGLCSLELGRGSDLLDRLAFQPRKWETAAAFSQLWLPHED